MQIEENVTEVDNSLRGNSYHYTNNCYCEKNNDGCFKANNNE